MQSRETGPLLCISFFVEFAQSYPTFFFFFLTVACQAPLSMEFSKEEHWSGLPFPSAGGLPDPGIEPGSPALQVNSLLSEPPVDK